MKKSVKRRRDTLSHDRIITVATTILDSKGESGLTFRTLAEHLSTGSGALYYYVTSKAQLLSTATDTIITSYLSALPVQSDPSLAIRNVALALWDAGESHPWVGSRLLLEPNRVSIAKIYEAIGSQLGPLGVPKKDQFNVTSAICSYIAGNISQESTNAQLSKTLASQGHNRESYLKQFTKTWRALDRTDYPFMHQIIDQFPTHDDREQYLVGIDLLLSGILRNYAHTNPTPGSHYANNDRNSMINR